MNLEFRRPARIDEVLEVNTRLHEMSAAVLKLDQVVTRDGNKLFEARVEVVLVSLEGKPQRLSARLREIFCAQ
jgi:acyl-CoA thioester hydrolase